MIIQNTTTAQVSNTIKAMNDTKESTRRELAKAFALKLSAKLKAINGVSLLG